MKHQKLGTTYIIALTVIAALVFIGTFVVNTEIGGLGGDSKMINLGGRQRMLSQKVTKAALILQQTTDIQEFNARKKELQETTDLLVKTHIGLQVGDESLGLEKNLLSEQNKATFKELTPHLEAIKQAAYTLTKLDTNEDSLSKAGAFSQQIPVILQNESVFLKLMNNIVSEMENNAKGKISVLNLSVYGVAGSILIALLLLAVFFFQPLVKSIREYVRNINESNEKLKTSEAELLASVEKTLAVNQQLNVVQTELKENQLFTRNVLQNAPLVMFSIDKEGVFTMSEGNDLKKLGLSSGQVVGANAFEMYQSNPDVVENLKAALSGREIDSVAKIGEMYFESRYTPLYNGNRDIIGAIGVASDVTEAKKAEEQLRRLSLVASKTDNAVMILDKTGVLEWANEAFVKMTEFEVFEVQGQHFEKYLNLAKISESEGSRIQQSLKQKVSVATEVLLQSKVGKAYWVNIGITPVLNENNELAQFVILQTDVTERKKAQEELERTLEMQKIINESLIIAQKEIGRKAEELQKAEQDVRGAFDKQIENSEKLYIAQRQITEQNNSLKKAFSAARMGMWKLTSETDGTGIFDFSDEYLEILGINPQEQGNNAMTFQQWVEKFVYPEDINRVLGEMRLILENPSAYSSQIEFRLVRANGDICTNITTIESAQQEQGKFITRGTAQDITERKRNEDAIKIQNEKLASSEKELLEAFDKQMIATETLYIAQRELTRKSKELEEQSIKMKQAFVISKSGAWGLEANLDGSEMYFSFSDEYYLLLGTNAEEQGGYKISFEEWKEKFLVVEEIASVIKQFENIIHNETAEVVAEFRLRKTDGTIIYHQASIKAKHYKEEGKIRGEGVTQDITERKRNEALIQEKGEQMQKALGELREIQNQMIMADKMREIATGLPQAPLKFTSKTDAVDFSYIDELKAKNLPVSDKEAARLEALYSYDILDTLPEEEFDKITRLASFICGTEIALISLIDKDRQWFKSRVGLEPQETSRDLAFCQHVIMDDKIMEVNNALNDDRFKENQLVLGDPNIRFYAGAPLQTEDGFNIGTLCVLDPEPMVLSELQKACLKDLSTMVMARLEAVRQKSLLVVVNKQVNEAFEQVQKTQEEVQRLSLVASKTENAVIITDANGLVEWVNDSFVRVTEYTLEEVKGKKPGKFLQGERTDPADVIAIREGLSAKKSFYREIRNYSKSGREYWLGLSITPTLDEQGNVVRFIAIESDITERKDKDEKLKNAMIRMERSEEEMRGLVEAQLEANERLVLAERKLQATLQEEQQQKEKLDRVLEQLKGAQSQLVHNEKMASLGQLTAGIAHEINNPINFVYNGIDTLKISLDDLLEIVEKYNELDNASEDKERILNEVKKLKKDLGYGELIEDVNHLVSDIKKGAIRTMEIVKGLRVFSRLDEEERKMANIGDCIDATLVLLNNKTKGKVEISKFYDNTMGEIPCYPGQLNQVFMNIINNAIQAVPDDKKDGKIEIYTENQQENVIIRIKDNGAGMPENVRKRIFEPFFTTKAVGVGTGLGLSITFGIIEKHEGNIYVNSEEGKGTEFVIQLPKKLL